MIKTILGIILTVVILTLIFKYFTGKSKPSNSRTSMEKIACSIFSIFNKNLSDAANSLRSTKVMRDEALQEVEKAMRNLKDSFTEGQMNMRVTLNKLKNEILPNLQDQPGKLEGKARKNKKAYQESQEKGTPIEAYKSNAINFLQMKNQAIKNIKKTENNIIKLEVAIEESKARYEGNITNLEMIKSELMTMVDIPQSELNASLDRIQSLQAELTDKMNVENIRAEVQNEIALDTGNSYNPDLDKEFENL